MPNTFFGFIAWIIGIFILGIIGIVIVLPLLGIAAEIVGGLLPIFIVGFLLWLGWRFVTGRIPWK